MGEDDSEDGETEAKEPEAEQEEAEASDEEDEAKGAPTPFLTWSCWKDHKNGNRKSRWAFLSQGAQSIIWDPLPTHTAARGQGVHPQMCVTGRGSS